MMTSVATSSASASSLATNWKPYPSLPRGHQYATNLDLAKAWVSVGMLKTVLQPVVDVLDLSLAHLGFVPGEQTQPVQEVWTKSSRMQIRMGRKWTLDDTELPFVASPFLTVMYQGPTTGAIELTTSLWDLSKHSAPRVGVLRQQLDETLHISGGSAELTAAGGPPLLTVRDWEEHVLARLSTMTTNRITAHVNQLMAQLQKTTTP